MVDKGTRFPLYLHMLGGEIVAHAHYDEYVMNFTSFRAASSNDLSAFDVPEECEEEEVQEGTPSRPLSLALASLVPGVRSLSYIPVTHSQVYKFASVCGHSVRSTHTIGWGVARTVLTNALPTVPALVLQADVGRTEYSDFREQQGRGTEDIGAHMKRAHTFLHHSAAVKQHNLRKDRRFNMALNKFADWSHDEFSAAMLGFKRSGETRAAIAAVQAGAPAPAGPGKRSKFQCAPHLCCAHLKSPSTCQRFSVRRKRAGGSDSFTDDGGGRTWAQQIAGTAWLLSADLCMRRCRHTSGFVATPGSVDWRGTGAVGVVKDQGVCGSCWSFSASQAMSSAHWMSTGEYVSLSEQQIMDCSWDLGLNSACNGGDPDLGVQYCIDNGGAYSEKDYPYKGKRFEST